MRTSQPVNKPRRPGRRAAITLGILACAIVSAACTSSSPSSPATHPTWHAKPCALLTQGEAAAALGQPVRPLNNDSTTGECSYAAGSSSVILFVGRWDDISSVDDLYPPSWHHTLVPAMGDQTVAFLGPSAILSVRKGAVGFSLTMTGPPVDGLPDKGLATLDRLARLVLNRL